MHLVYVLGIFITICSCAFVSTSNVRSHSFACEHPWRFMTRCMQGNFDDGSSHCPSLQYLHVDKAYFGYSQHGQQRRKRDAEPSREQDEDEDQQQRRERDGNFCYRSGACGAHNVTVWRDLMFDADEFCDGEAVHKLQTLCERDCSLLSPSAILPHCTLTHGGRRVTPHYMVLLYVCKYNAETCGRIAGAMVAIFLLGLVCGCCYGRHAKCWVLRSKPVLPPVGVRQKQYGYKRVPVWARSISRSGARV